MAVFHRIWGISVLLLHSCHSTNVSQNVKVLEGFALCTTAALSPLCIAVVLVRIFQAGLCGIALEKASCLTFVVLLYFFIICWEFLHLRNYYKVSMKKQIYLYTDFVYCFLGRMGFLNVNNNLTIVNTLK